MRPNRGFTLIELMVVIAVAGVLLALAAPSFRELILLQRLKGVSSQIVTDMQFARSEAAARNQNVRVLFSNDAAKTCYVLFTGTSASCSCTRTPICDATGFEIRTVELARTEAVLIHPRVLGVPFLAFDPATGAVLTASTDLSGAPVPQFIVDTCIGPPGTPNCGTLTRRIRTEIKLSGRPGLCSPAGSSIGLATC